MSSFYYKWNEKEPKLAVRCDGCKKALFTNYTGQEFPLHITEQARTEGWTHRKISATKWVDYCPECEAYARSKERERTFGIHG